MTQNQTKSPPYRRMVELSPHGMALVGKDNRYTYTNPAFLKIFGYTREEMPAEKDWFRLLFPDSILRNAAISQWVIERRQQNGEVVDQGVFTVHCKDGETKTVRVFVIQISDDEKLNTYEVLTSEPDALDWSGPNESLFREVVEQSPYGIIIFNPPEGDFLLINSPGADIFGHSKSEFENLTLWELVHPKEHESLRSRMKNAITTPNLRQEPVTYTGIRKDKSLLRFDITLSRIRHNGKPSIMGLVRDVTGSEQISRQMQHMQKMEAVGTLANGVAHEFNNILMAIRGYSQLLSQVTQDMPQVERLLHKINDNTERAAELTEKMLAFSRIGEGEKVTTDINQVVGLAATLIKNTLPSNIEVNIELAPDLPFVIANRNQMEQVILGLAANARDAMPSGGTITIKTKLTLLDNEFCRVHHWASPGRYIEIEFSDTGRGMEPAILERMFEPFFTTKEPGRGTGLGLAVAYSVLKSHRGYILAKSELDEGCTFRIFLPGGGNLFGETSDLMDPELFKGKGQQILVVDDEMRVKDYYHKALTKLGYSVTTASNGGEAMRLYRTAMDSGEAFDLVLLDYAMPVMDGLQCAEQIIALNENASIILVTGYGSDFFKKNKKPDFVTTMLFKPVEFRTLAKEVEAALVNNTAEKTDSF